MKKLTVFLVTTGVVVGFCVAKAIETPVTVHVPVIVEDHTEDHRYGTVPGSEGHFDFAPSTPRKMKIQEA